MNAKSIQQLRIKFILIAMCSVAVVEFFIASFINITNSVTTSNNIHMILDYLCENEGDLLPRGSGTDGSLNNKDESISVPDAHSGAAREESRPDAGDESASASQTEEAGENVIEEYQDLSVFSVFANSITSESSSPEFQYATRYFAVLYDKDGTVTEIKKTHIAAFDDDEASYYSSMARSRGRRYGSFGIYNYEYLVRDDGSSIVVVMDCRTQVHTIFRLFYASVIICLGCLVIIFWPVFIYSNKLIQPEIRNIERQKIFITNASHELKTPLAVIRANTEVLEMLNGSNEWTESTMRQVDRMNGLIKNLVQIARAEEQADKSALSRIDVGKIVAETADTFRTVAESDGKTMATDINDDVTIIADEAMIRQLTSLLVDNAIKYCDDGGTVTIHASKKGRAARIVVSNNFADGANVDYSHFFERFYRNDPSHNTEKGGYGIGLSIAESIVRQYRGDISASWKNGVISFTCIIP